MQAVTDMVCRWDAPDGVGSVFLSSSTIRDLRSKAIEAFVSLPKRGVEIGGLLFGREQGGNLFIQGFGEVSCEHRYGPSFTLSDTDRANLNGRLSQAPRDGSLPVIGFYRSYTGRKSVLETAELAMLRERFPEGPFVFLLLQPVTAQICTAAFRLCRDGELLPEPPYTPVSFDPEEFNGGAQTEPADPVEPAETDTRSAAETDFQTDRDPEPAVPEPAVPGPSIPSPAPIERELSPARPPRLPRLPPPYRSLAVEPGPPETAQPDRSARTRWWLPILVCLLGGVGGAVVYEFWTLARQPQWAELHLDAQRSADARSVAITWDAAAPKSVSATHALLAINDGSVHVDVPLSQEQVQLGRYLYTPDTPTRADLELRMILYGDGPALSGGTLRLEAPQRLAQKSPARPLAQESAAPLVAQEPPLPAELPRLAPPPAVIHEVQPRIPEGIRARLRDPVEIPVEVKIDAAGRVIAASTPSTGDGLRKYLAGEAVKAARQWRFGPARRGASTTGEKTISFTFVP